MDDKPKPLRFAVIGTGGRGTHLLRLALAGDGRIPPPPSRKSACRSRDRR